MSKVVSKAASHHKARLSLVLQPDALRSVGVAMSISERLDPAPFFDYALSFIGVFEVVILGQLLDSAVFIQEQRIVSALPHKDDSRVSKVGDVHL